MKDVTNIFTLIVKNPKQEAEQYAKYLHELNGYEVLTMHDPYNQYSKVIDGELVVRFRTSTMEAEQ